MYEMLAGSTPFVGENAATMRKSVVKVRSREG